MYETIYVIYLHKLHAYVYCDIHVHSYKKKNAFSVKQKNRYKNLLIVDDSVESILHSASNRNLTIANLNIIRVYFRRKSTNILDIDRRKGTDTDKKWRNKERRVDTTRNARLLLR